MISKGWNELRHGSRRTRYLWEQCRRDFTEAGMDYFLSEVSLLGDYEKVVVIRDSAEKTP